MGGGSLGFSCGEGGPLGFYGMGVSKGLLFFLIEKPKKNSSPTDSTTDISVLHAVLTYSKTGKKKRTQSHARMVHTAPPRATRPRGATRMCVMNVHAVAIATAGDMRYLVSRSMLVGCDCAHASVARCFKKAQHLTDMVFRLRSALASGASVALLAFIPSIYSDFRSKDRSAK